MEYKVIIIDHRRIVKTLSKGTVKRSLYDEFKRLVKKNSEIKFPKRYINKGGIFEIQYYICMVEPLTEDNKDKGEIIFDKYIIIHKEKYDLEEKFWVYGYHPKTDKKELDEVAAILFTYRNKLNNRRALTLRNKLVVYNEERFDMVICKCDKDAQRLHHTLHAIAKSMKYNNIVFMGTCAFEHLNTVYWDIVEHTGWPYDKVIRSTTRP
jgi:hypothetical protein